MRADRCTLTPTGRMHGSSARGIGVDDLRRRDSRHVQSAAVLSQKIRRESRATPNSRRFQLPQPTDTDEWF